MVIKQQGIEVLKGTKAIKVKLPPDIYEAVRIKSILVEKPVGNVVKEFLVKWVKDVQGDIKAVKAKM